MSGPGTGRGSRDDAGTWSLRPAEPRDLAAVIALLEAADLPAAGVKDAFAGFVVAEGEGRIQGVAGLEVHGGEGVLRSVAVHPDARGHGLGARLTGRIVEGAAAAGLRRLFLLTTTAQGYFPRYGFRPVARDAASPEVQASVEFREACPASAVAMVLELDRAGARSGVY